MIKDLTIAAALSVGACVLIGLIGAAVLRRFRRKSLRAQLRLNALLPVLAVVVAVVVDVAFMFLSGHDAGVLLVALATAVVLAGVGAWLVTRSVVTGLNRLTDALGDLVAVCHQIPGGPERLANEHSRAGPDASASTGLGPELPVELVEALATVELAGRTVAEARARERGAETARRELVGFMSHDLRTPLAGLRAVVEGLEDGIVVDVPRALKHFKTTVGRMSVLVDDLFALSRVQGSARPVQRQQVSLAEVVDDVVAEAAPTAAAAGVTLALMARDDDRLAVSGQYADLTRALANLVANAIHHTDPGRGVEVRAGRTPTGAVHIEVVDQCGGIPEDSLDHVFEAGWRGNPARPGDHGGAGLGLAIVRGVAESHDGRIGVHNTDDGCVFALELPPGDDAHELARQ